MEVRGLGKVAVMAAQRKYPHELKYRAIHLVLNIDWIPRPIHIFKSRRASVPNCEFRSNVGYPRDWLRGFRRAPALWSTDPQYNYIEDD